MAPAITQVTINRVNNLEKPEDTAQESAELSSGEPNEAQVSPSKDVSLDDKAEIKLMNVLSKEDVAKEENLDFKTARDAEAYYRIF